VARHPDRAHGSVISIELQSPEGTEVFMFVASEKKIMRRIFVVVWLMVGVACLPAFGAVTPGKPAGLRADALVEPLGLDGARPVLSWQLRDERSGALQTAYEILVSTKPGVGSSDVWDSGKVASAASSGVPYGGPELKAQTRYYWRVKVWDKDGKVYPESDPSWWETGLMGASGWKAKWIGYEASELHSIRTSGAVWITNAAVMDYRGKGDTHHDFRFRVSLHKPVKRAVLYTTGADTVAAWVNGKQVMEAQPLTAWKQMPWGTYEHRDVTAEMRSGKNSIAIEVTHFDTGGAPMGKAPTQSPMSACLYVVAEDGSTEVFRSESEGWKATLNAGGTWYGEDVDDSSWKAAERYAPSSNSFGASDQGLPWPTGPVAALRRGFEERSPVVSARLYATALGAYKIYLNGKPVGDQILAPGWMDFREHVPYQVYDVSKMVVRGQNVMAAYLAAGWYSTPLMWFRQGNNYGGTEPALRAQLRVEHADGSVEWIVTDDSWKAQSSGILSSEIYDGETYDARKSLPGWTSTGMPERGWTPASVVDPKEPEIIAQYFPPIREERVMTAKAVTNPSPGVYIFDFGQNMSGVPRMKITGHAGQDVRLRFAEVLNPDGTMYIDNLRTAKATDHFILAGVAGGEEYQPLFTYHGFRYMEITGVDAKPSLESLKAVVFHTDAAFTTRFTSGDAMVNQLWSNILWGQRSNFIGVPTDCPQRDERLGWSADAQVFWRTAAYNMDLTTFSQKYAADLQGTQVTTAMYGIFAPGTITANPGYGAAWSDAGVIVPWTGWIQSGDGRIIEQNWKGMEAYLAEIARQNPDMLWRNGFGASFGDWLTPTQTTPEDLIATAYWAYDVSLMRQMAMASGREAEARRYEELFAKIKAAFQKQYVRADGFVGSPDTYPSIPPPTIAAADQNTDPRKIVETQTGYVLALHMNLMPEALRAAAATKLVKKIEENHWLLGTGFLGTPYLLEVLSDTGHSDVAYRLLLNKEYPSWGYLIEHGATTTWERWNGDTMRADPSMNSYNHYAYGAVAEWMYRYAAGVDTMANDPGFHTISLHPNFDRRLGHLEFAYDSPYGEISSNWKIEGSEVSWEVRIPANTSARLPVSIARANALRIDGLPLEKSSAMHLGPDGVYELSAGAYRFHAVLPAPGAGASATSLPE
jgi:alpha-L-rhamnosidase